MSHENRIVFISSEDTTIESFKKIIAGKLSQYRGRKIGVHTFRFIPSLDEVVTNYAPSLIVVNIEPDQMEAKMEFISQLGRLANRIPVVVSAPAFDTELMMTCVKRGVKDFLNTPFKEDEIKEMFLRILEDAGAVSAKGVGLAETFTFFSYKGGIGNTFLACNTAVALSRITGKRVLLWDLVLQNGDVPFFFDVEPNVNLSDLMENLPDIDESYLRGTLPIHSSGVAILSGPKRPEEAEGIRYDQIQGLRQVLNQYYDYIVIDGGHVLTDQIIGALDISKHILLTTDLHLPVLKNTLRCVEVFERLGYVEGKFKIILNRYNSKYETFDLDRAREILRYPIAFAFTNDYVTVSRSLNTGIPIAELEENSQLAKQFESLANLLITDFKADVEKSFSILDRFKSLFPSSKKAKKREDEKVALSKAAERVKHDGAE
ncbi:MAG: hypothetical protein JW893_01265 [Candidatus Omnitrophica bacterium]|nr:hypothetical protein [Candidatus Omnitrophota bacterium]